MLETRTIALRIEAGMTPLWTEWKQEGTLWYLPVFGSHRGDLDKPQGYKLGDSEKLS